MYWQCQRLFSRNFLRVFGVLFIAFLGVSCTPAQKKPKHILFITFDTTRWDHVGFASGEQGLTPMLDAMAKRGTFFNTAIAAQPLTLPSHTTLFTGLYPPQHGVRNNGTYIVPPSTLTLAEVLKDEGFQTHAVTSAFVLDSQFGLDQGFETYDDDLSHGPKQKAFMFKEVKADRTAQRGALWLRNQWDKERPFFMWMHFFDPHADYEPPPDVAHKFPTNPYKGEIHYADRELGRVFKELEALGALDDTLLVFTSDHGDSLGEHGEKTHGLFIYDATTRVPLLFSGPGVPDGKRVDAVVRSADIFPTILELFGLDIPEGLDGKSLSPLWHGDERERRLAYVETLLPRLNFGWSELRALRGAGQKAIQAPRAEYYDLEKDPAEKLNRLIVEGPDIGADLFEQLNQLKAKDPFETGEHAQAELDPEVQERLVALGYIWDDSHHELDGPLIDPKDRLTFYERFQSAQHLIRIKEYEKAITVISRLLAEDPGNIVARSSMATALVHMGEDDRALAVYAEIREADPKRDSAYLGPARIHRERGNFAEAERYSRAVIEMQPKAIDGYLSLAETFLEKGDYDESEAFFRKALEVDEHSSLAKAGLGNCLNRAGRVEEAHQVLTAARQADTTSHAVAYNLAVVSDRLGQRDLAFALYQEAVKLNPEHSMSWNNLGSLLEKKGKPEDGIRYIAKAYELDPDNMEATLNLGALLFAGGKAKEAIPHIQRVLKTTQEFPHAIPLLAKAHLAAGEMDQSIKVWSVLARANPVGYLEIAIIEAKRGNQDAALKAIEMGQKADGMRFLEAAKRRPALRELLNK